MGLDTPVALPFPSLIVLSERHDWVYRMAEVAGAFLLRLCDFVFISVSFHFCTLISLSPSILGFLQNKKARAVTHSGIDPYHMFP